MSVSTRCTAYLGFKAKAAADKPGSLQFITALCNSNWNLPDAASVPISLSLSLSTHLACFAILLFYLYDRNFAYPALSQLVGYFVRIVSRIYFQHCIYSLLISIIICISETKRVRTTKFVYMYVYIIAHRYILL